MKPEYIHDKAELEAYLLQHTYHNAYHLGDLDDFFWPYTSWIGVKKEGELKAVSLLYAGTEPIVLLSIENNNFRIQKELLESSLFMLPKNFYSHLSPGLEEVLQAHGCELDLWGEHYKMGLTTFDQLDDLDTSSVEQLGPSNLEEMQTLYAASYPNNWFDPRMLETEQYTGIRDEEGNLVSVAGIHVYSPEYKIAALGNITTHPDHRGQGLGAVVTAGLCKLLLKTVDKIGLNVKTSNTPAIKAYQKIGFEVKATYNEWMVNSPTS